MEVFEKRVAALENDQSAIAVASGAAVVLMTVMTLAKAGDNIISSRNLYNGTFSQFDRLLSSFEVRTRYFESSESNIKNLIDDRIKLIFSESVANPHFAVADYEKLISIAHEANIPVVVSYIDLEFSSCD